MIKTTSDLKHRWFSGRMLACHAGGPGSIPGRCNFFYCNLHIYSVLLFRYMYNDFVLVPNNVDLDLIISLDHPKFSQVFRTMQILNKEVQILFITALFDILREK